MCDLSRCRGGDDPGLCGADIEVAKETVDLTRQNVEARVAESVELVQSQEPLATVDLDYISSAFAHNLAKLTLARAMGCTEEDVPKFLNLRSGGEQPLFGKGRV